jgi:hypothetical protein
MKLAIMQPYLFPYIGYFQLMNVVDEFVVYDNIQYSKKGWINRNRILVNGTDAYITFPLKKDSDYLDVKDRYLSDDWVSERKKPLNRIIDSYRKAPYFKDVYSVIEKIILFEETNLFKFTLNSLTILKEFLSIKTTFSISSEIAIDHELKSERKVIEICKAKKATNYINPIGGLELYNKNEFKKEGINIRFLKTTNVNYKQFNNEFVPMLSIIDVMMFNTKEEIKNYLDNCYTLL